MYWLAMEQAENKNFRAGCSGTTTELHSGMKNEKYTTVV